eukprot:CAMPEP_0119313748 /NCGR_PEP_ID=MMETSP1333-20130426/30250_1 /TAXON_ID=418940 /ORGANISM="Scyphosphaera apsteinii, Strain RCC1455" /LENGTH=107 /DNA_ID=CAMNT_0007318673 /DNA_START=687 /DNA_END=1010 /DNA_ORIENTATION=-
MKLALRLLVRFLPSRKPATIYTVVNLGVYPTIGFVDLGNELGRAQVDNRLRPSMRVERVEHPNDVTGLIRDDCAHLEINEERCCTPPSVRPTRRAVVVHGTKVARPT